MNEPVNEAVPPRSEPSAWSRRVRRVLPWVLLVVVAVGVYAGYSRYTEAHKKPDVELRSAAVERRRIVGRVTASGTLQAVVTVQVGTQVSGRIQKLFADFNSPVKKGQLIAKIDPQIFEANVAQARASYDSAAASVEQADAKVKDAQRTADRTKALAAQGLAAETDVQAADTGLAVAKANVNAAKAQLEQATAQLNQASINLAYTSIVSPIDGVIISRNVDVGQTVAASLQAPVLFTIAEDLKKMQVNTNVAEGDVGRLSTGMPATFSVDAFPGQKFKGKISQIRNAPQTVQNVVTYDAVIDVDNDQLKLRPGMTANVTIEYDTREDALAVPNAALRFRAPPQLSVNASASASGVVPIKPKPHDVDDTTRTVWVPVGVGARPVTVTIGLSDGTVTEITSDQLVVGDMVVVDATVNTTAATTTVPGAAGGGGTRRLGL